jgi:hypothetical protein
MAKERPNQTKDVTYKAFSNYVGMLTPKVVVGFTFRVGIPFLYSVVGTCIEDQKYTRVENGSEVTWWGLRFSPTWEIT